MKHQLMNMVEPFFEMIVFFLYILCILVLM